MYVIYVMYGIIHYGLDYAMGYCPSITPFSKISRYCKANIKNIITVIPIYSRQINEILFGELVDPIYNDRCTFPYQLIAYGVWGDEIA